ncbi:enolase C-terminal domain-like protein, partial [Streptomyces pathocidini]|uniref:enolase C-terminal domain-like protein n=1 Tax=Streptomyces pathocidini TaxID=1650571 RepID=UPI000A54AA40
RAPSTCWRCSPPTSPRVRLRGRTCADRNRHPVYLDYACDSHYPWQTEDVITRRHTFRDGRLPVSDAPGLGVELDRDALAALHKRWLVDDGTMRDRDDAAAMRKADPEWATPAVPRW